ncbi:MAG: HDOD domain-containing protein [Burkholderiales bacterium]|nr:HDOD domain-containing protein [Burkholderiales bacterium]
MFELNSEELVKKFGSAAEKMPAFPKSVQRILELTRNIDCQPREIVSVIEKDPVMTVRILKVLNSPYYNLPGKITSINRSIVYLGFNTIKNLALGIALIGVLPKQNKAGFDIHQYLRHSLVVAGISRLLCGRIASEADPTACYIAGLLHDFGKVVFAQFMTDEFRAALDLAKTENMPLHLAEEHILGADHCLMGSMLAEKWQLPEFLVETIRHHHDYAGEDSDILACVVTANHISKQAAWGGSGTGMEAPPPFAAARCGGIEITAEETVIIREEAEIFSKIGGEA